MAPVLLSPSDLLLGLLRDRAHPEAKGHRSLLVESIEVCFLGTEQVKKDRWVVLSSLQTLTHLFFIIIL